MNRLGSGVECVEIFQGVERRLRRSVSQYQIDRPTSKEPEESHDHMILYDTL